MAQLSNGAAVMRKPSASPWQDGALLGSLHLLLFDPNPVDRKHLRRALLAAGLQRITEVTTAAVSNTAMSPVDVVLSEVDLQGNGKDRGGLALLKAIRTGRVPGLRSNLCFIYVTGALDRHVVEVAARLDANGYLMKPLSVDRLRATILRGLRRDCPLDMPRYGDIQEPTSLRRPPSPC